MKDPQRPKKSVPLIAVMFCITVAAMVAALYVAGLLLMLGK